MYKSDDLTVSNFLTDILDAMIREDFDGVFLITGEAPGFRRKSARIETPEFNYGIDVDELRDSLEALGFDINESMSMQECIHRSDYFPDTYFEMSITHIGTSGEAPVVRIRHPLNKKLVVE